MRWVARGAVLAASLGVPFVVACGAAAEDGSPGPDAAATNQDASVPRDGGPAPRLLVVNALSEGQGAAYDAVRLCLPNGNPLPSTLVPLSNVAGIGRGTGADLGGVLGGSQNLTLDVFDAKNVSKFSGNCAVMRVTFQGQFTELTQTLPTPNVSLVALVTDDTKPEHVGVRVFDLGVDDAFAPDHISAVAVNLSQAKGSITLNPGGGSPVVATDVKASGSFSMDLAPEALVTIDYPGGTVQQTLQSIQYASDPTSTPTAFFGQRKVFLFALVGDPQVPYDASKPAQELTGRELRIVAIPYGD